MFGKFKKRYYEKKLQEFIRKNQECSLYIGMAGSGKTTYIAYIVNLCNKCGKRVFCNVPVLGAIPYTKDDIGKYDMSDSIILLDEAGIMYDNRQFTTAFTNESLIFLKLLRHYRANIALFSQSMDIDAKWVRMSKTIFFVKRSLILGFTKILPIKRTLDVNEDTHKIEDFYDKPTGLSKIFCFRFRRKPYYKMFDSYSAPKLPQMESLEPYNTLNDNFSSKKHNKKRGF